jgi:hypothetical protein
MSKAIAYNVLELTLFRIERLVEIFAPKLALGGKSRNVLTANFNRIRATESLEEYSRFYNRCKKIIVKRSECISYSAVEEIPESFLMNNRLCFMLVYENFILFLTPFPKRCYPLNKKDLSEMFQPVSFWGKLLKIGVGVVKEDVRIVKY